MKGPAGFPMALLAVFAAVIFFALCGLVVSLVAAFRRWRFRHTLGR